MLLRHTKGASSASSSRCNAIKYRAHRVDYKINKRSPSSRQQYLSISNETKKVTGKTTSAKGNHQWHNTIMILSPRDALQCKARSCDCMSYSSVRLSVCKTNVSDLWYTVWKSWKLIARTIGPTPSFFVAQRPSMIHILPGEHAEILGRLYMQVGWEKVVCWSTKAAISLKNVKIEETLLWRAYRNSPTLFRTVPDPLRPPFRRLEVRNPPKTPVAIFSTTGKATTFKFCMHIHRIDRNKSPLKSSGKVAVGVIRDSRAFSEHPYIGRIARSSLR